MGDSRARPATENGLMNVERPESVICHGNPRPLSLGGQSILLGAALLTGTTVVGWMALNAGGSAAIWRSTAVASTTLAVLVLSMALAWRLVAQCRGILDELVLGLERVSMGDLSHRLDESGSAEMRRVAIAFNSAVQNSACRAEVL